MTARQTVPRLKAFAFAVRSLWDFHMIYGETGHGNLEMDRSHDNIYINSRLPLIHPAWVCFFLLEMPRLLLARLRYGIRLIASHL